MLLNSLAILIAILLSIAAGIISVIGLAAIFSGAWLEVVIVASILEAAKIITATWLHSNWHKTRSIIKWYLSIAVIVLMAITSLGIFGFFSKAHIEQQIKLETGDKSKIPLFKKQLDDEKKLVTDIENQIKFIDSNLSSLSEKSKNQKEVRLAITEADKQRKQRQQLTDQKNSIQLRVLNIETQINSIENTIKKQEIETGPIKYVSSIFLTTPTVEQQERAVIILIIVIMLVFDPLAIALLILATYKAEEPKTTVAAVNSTPKKRFFSIIKQRPIYRKKERRTALNLSKIKL